MPSISVYQGQQFPYFGVIVNGFCFHLAATLLTQCLGKLTCDVRISAKHFALSTAVHLVFSIQGEYTVLASLEMQVLKPEVFFFPFFSRKRLHLIYLALKCPMRLQQRIARSDLCLAKSNSLKRNCLGKYDQC